MRDDRSRLIDILEALERMRRYTDRGRQTFDEDELVQVWVVHHLQIIGEACAAVPDHLRATQSEIPWRSWVGMRNVIVHEYFGVDLDLAWRVATTDVAELDIAIREILAVVEAE